MNKTLIYCYQRKTLTLALETEVEVSLDPDDLETFCMAIDKRRVASMKDDFS